MKKVFFFFFAVLSLPVFAEGLAIAPRVSTLGLSLDISKSLSQSTSLRLGLNTFSYDQNISESDIDYKFDLNLKSAGLFLDWHPGKSTFRISAGLLYNGNEADLDAVATSGTYIINGVTYTVTDVGNLQGSMRFKSSAPYVGIGWGNAGSKKRGWGLMVDIGALYQNTPEVSMTVTCGSGLTVAQCNTLTADVQAEATQLKTELESYEWYPVVSIGAQYRF